MTERMNGKKAKKGQEWGPGGTEHSSENKRVLSKKTHASSKFMPEKKAGWGCVHPESGGLRSERKHSNHGKTKREGKFSAQKA